MKLWKVLVFLSCWGLGFFLAGFPTSADALYEAGNDYNLYGHLYQYDVPVIGDSACCPTSAINSFTYLQNQYPGVYGTSLTSSPPTIAEVQKIAGPDYLNWQPGLFGSGGVAIPYAMWGRYLYIESRLPFQTRYSYQVATKDGQPLHGDKIGNPWPANRPLPTPNSPGIIVPTWQFIFDNLQKGADLGVGVTYLNDGIATDGHCLTLSRFSFDDKNNNGIIDKGEGSVSFVDPASKNEVTCNVWQNSVPTLLSRYPYLILDYRESVYSPSGFIDAIIAEYPMSQAIPDTVAAGNILVLKTNSPYGTLTYHGGVLYALEPQTIWNKALILGLEGGILDSAANNTCTLTGAISGQGAFSKMGSGILFLRGTNSYSGGTMLLEGTANIASDENLGDPSGSIIFQGGTLQAGAALALSRTLVCNRIQGLEVSSFNTFDTGFYVSTLKGVLTGDGNLWQTGQGSLTLRGDASAFRGNYTLHSGTLTVENTFGQYTGNMTVNPNGILQGTGFLAVQQVTNHGTVNPGNSVGTLTVDGRYIQEADGRLRVEVASPTSYDRLRLSGIAELNGAVQPVLLAGYRPPANTVFRGILTSERAVIETFAALENNTPIRTWQALYSPTQVDLTLTRDYAKPSFGLNANQHAVGTMFNRVADTTSGDLAEVLNTLDNLPTPSAIAHAYQQVSPDKVAALSTLAFAGANLQKGLLSRRITDLRFGNREATVLGGFPGSFNLNYSQTAGLMLAYNSSNLAGLLTSGREAGLAPAERHWGLYLDPALVLGSQQSSANQTGFDFTIAGFNAGADYRVRDDLLVGLVSGYSHTGASFKGSGGSVQTNTWPLTAYAAYLPQFFYAYGSVGYALNLFNLERQLSFEGLNRSAKSLPTGNQFNAYAEAGYDLKLKPLVVTPVLSLAYSSLWVDGFTESGAGALNLKVSPQQVTSLQTGVGAKVALPIKRNSMVTVPQVYATYQHEYSDSSRGLDARLSQAGSTFAFQTEAPHRDFAVVGTSVNILTQKNFQVRLDYNAEVGRGNYAAHYVSAGVRWQF
jgi:outer membrane autotransporter protein